MITTLVLTLRLNLSPESLQSANHHLSMSKGDNYALLIYVPKRRTRNLKLRSQFASSQSFVVIPVKLLSFHAPRDIQRPPM